MIERNNEKTSRSPHGERGLKLLTEFAECISNLSFPSRGTGIETSRFAKKLSVAVSFPSRGTGIETSPIPLMSKAKWVVPRKGNGD